MILISHWSLRAPVLSNHSSVYCLFIAFCFLRIFYDLNCPHTWSFFFKKKTFHLFYFLFTERNWSGNGRQGERGREIPVAPIHLSWNFHLQVGIRPLNLGPWLLKCVHFARYTTDCPLSIWNFSITCIQHKDFQNCLCCLYQYCILVLALMNFSGMNIL